MRKCFIAALAVLGAMTIGCNRIELPEPAGNEGQEVTLTTTLSLGKPESKALSAAGVKYFAAGEQIAVVYENTDGAIVMTVSNPLEAEEIQDEGKKVAITVTLTNPAQNGALRYVYPSSKANSDGSVKYPALDMPQDGTFTSLATGLDLALYEGTLTPSAGLPVNVTLTNPLCIGEFNIISGGNDITAGITMMTVFDGTNAYIVNRAAGAGPIYVALQPVSGDKTLQFCATDGTTTYRRHFTGHTLAAGNMYPVNLTMPVDSRTSLELLTGNHTLQDGETLTGVLLGTYKISTPSTGENDEPITVTLDGVDINGTFPDKVRGAGILCNGNTILNLAEGSDNKVTGTSGGYAGVFIDENRTLTIRGGGALTATGTHKTGGSYGAAGIGGQKGKCGSIVIEGGTIVARGGYGSAGIGTGYQKGNGTVGGDFTISIKGGNVTATGGTNGAGIGTGMSPNPSEKNTGKNHPRKNICGDILISGGTVVATGGEEAAGIGCGYARSSTGYDVNNQCGNILISGGTVVATGGEDAAGIGCGYASGEKPKSKTKSDDISASVQCGTITITADVTSVKVIKGDGAPDSIGKGGKTVKYALQTCGTVTIGDNIGEVSTSPYTYQP